MGFHIQWDICSDCITSSARPVTARSPHLMSQMFYCITRASQCIMIQRFEMEVWGNQLFVDPSVWRDTFNDLLDSHLACDRSICPLMAYAMRFHTNLLLSSEVSFGGLRNKLLWKAVLADGGHLAQHHRGQCSGFGSGRYRPDVWLTAGATLDLLSLWPTLPHRSALK